MTGADSQLETTGPSRNRIPIGGRPHELYSSLRGLTRELWRDKGGMIGLIALLALVLTALGAPWIAPHDPTAQSLSDRLLPPFWEGTGSARHLLGTDHLGRDVLSRIIVGSRISLLVGVTVVLVAGVFGISAGLIAGYREGRLDAFIMRCVDTQVAFPGLLLALIILAVVGPSMWSIILVLSFNGWMVYARMARGITVSAKQSLYVEAAEVIGCRPSRVIFRHILPNLTSPLLTLAILEFARIVLAEAALSFLGLGIQPPAMSWGLDVASGKDYMFRAWWLVTFPGIAIAITVLAVNLLASWARVTSDPQEREKRFAREIARRRPRSKEPAFSWQP